MTPVEIKSIEGGRFAGMCYRDRGKGFPLLLVHGFPADGTLWDGQASFLAERYRVLVPDLPGSGDAPGIIALSIEDMADALLAILDQEAIPTAIVVGHSMGGYATLAFAEKYSSRLKGFGLFHSTAFEDTPEKKEGRLRSMEMMRRYGGPAFLRQMLPNLFSRAFRLAHPEVLRHLAERAARSAPGTLAGYYEAMRSRPDRTNVLRRAEVPVLFVVGREDTAAPVADVLKQVSLPAAAEVALWEGIAHMGMLEAPEKAAAVLDRFVGFCLKYPGFSVNNPS